MGTGEISLRGAVLPVGGIKAKLLAAHAAGVKRVVVPAENEEDVNQLDEAVRSSMKVFFAAKIEDALQHIFQTDSRHSLGTAYGAKILNSLSRKQPGVTVTSSGETMTGMDSCHPRIVSML